VESLTRQGLEEYVSDCVILLDFRVIEQIATRRLRIIKYRGSTHGTNEYPFLIDETGISVIPVTSLKLDYKSSTEIISTGLPALDHLFTGGGIYKGSSTLITGTAGTAKTILATYFAMSSCQRKEPVLYFSFEESPDQLVRNMQSIGLNLKAQTKANLLHIHASRPSLQGLEMHLLTLNKLVASFKPGTVIIDPISSLITIGSNSEVRAMLIRLMDSFKIKHINAFFTSLTHISKNVYDDATVDAVSSLADIWIHVKNEQKDNERVRSLLILKARGMGHFNHEQPFTITKKVIQFLNPEKK
jgi:circadian clock protein KaiC